MVGCGSTATGAADYYYSVYRGDNPLLEIHDVDGLAGGTYTPHLEHRYMYGLATDQILASENSLGEVLWGLGDNEGTIRDVVRSTTQAATVGAWSFEEASGSTINDASAYQNDGQLSASPPTRVTGLYGDALQFNGSNNSATIPASSSLNGIAGSFTVELCFKYNGAGTAGKACWTLLNKNATGEGYNTPFHLYINASDKHVYARVGNNSTEYYLVSAAAVDDGQYHQVDLVYDDVGRTYKLYLDGQLNYTKDSLLDGWTAAQNTDPVTLGYWSAYGDYFNGILDEVQILTRALSADEISQSRVNHRKLDSFGNVTEYNASNVVVTDGPLAGDFPFAFTGKSYDVSVGLYYYSARWYDSLTGRFVSADPAGLSADANLYRYVGNDPLNNTDPTGLCSISSPSLTTYYSRLLSSYVSSSENDPLLGPSNSSWTDQMREMLASSNSSRSLGPSLGGGWSPTFSAGISSGPPPIEGLFTGSGGAYSYDVDFSSALCGPFSGGTDVSIANVATQMMIDDYNRMNPPVTSLDLAYLGACLAKQQQIEDNVASQHNMNLLLGAFGGPVGMIAATAVNILDSTHNPDAGRHQWAVDVGNFGTCIALEGAGKIGGALLRSGSRGATAAYEPYAARSFGISLPTRSSGTPLSRIMETRSVAPSAVNLESRSIVVMGDSPQISQVVVGAGRQPIVTQTFAPVPGLPSYNGTTSGLVVPLEPPGTPFVLQSSAGTGARFPYLQADGHVETGTALWMGQNNVTRASVFHNNPNGTCGNCDYYLPTFLNQNSVLDVIPPANAVAPTPRWIIAPKSYTGNSRSAY